ncbi:hypothetical protein ACN27F_05435 [Solwaraspora sp. WMMB335]|uniref:hypothetical protein n=1 Tax=Solwaraspora sp. WMMB335 TaxID=3404118 RepID=UPI003B9545B3
MFTFLAIAPGHYTVAASAGTGDCGLGASSEVTVPGPGDVALFLFPVADPAGNLCQELIQPYVPAVGTALPLTGDNAIIEVALPFPVTFYGQPYSTAWVDTSGILTFIDPGGSHPVPVGVPSAGGPDAMIAAFWDDLIVDAQASVVTQARGSGPFQEFVVEWRDVRRAADPTERVTFQITLSAQGYWTVSYTGIDPASPGERGAYATIGVENTDGSAGLEYSAGAAVLVDDRAVVFL